MHSWSNLVRATCDVIRNDGYGIQPFDIARLSCCNLFLQKEISPPRVPRDINRPREIHDELRRTHAKIRPRQTLSHPYTHFPLHLVTGTAGLGDDALELVDLRLGAAESSELGWVLVMCIDNVGS